MIKLVSVWNREVLTFGIVGLIGFSTDAGLFLLSTQLAGLAIIPSRVLAFVPATIVTWMLNRTLVFRSKDSSRRKRDEYSRYLLVQSIGIAVNFVVFILAVHYGLGHGSAQIVPLVLGSLAAMWFNFVGAKAFVFLR